MKVTLRMDNLMVMAKDFGKLEKLIMDSGKTPREMDLVQMCLLLDPNMKDNG